jgi:cytolysin-activating lysine-acyltransferase
MGVPRYRKLSLADLEWAVLAPLVRNQLNVISARDKDREGEHVAGIMVWARVSAAVDAKIRAQIDKGIFPVRLDGDDWAGGDIVWLLDVVTPVPKIALELVPSLMRTHFGGKKIEIHPMIAGHGNLASASRPHGG